MRFRFFEGDEIECHVHRLVKIGDLRPAKERRPSGEKIGESKGEAAHRDGDEDPDGDDAEKLVEVATVNSDIRIVSVILGCSDDFSDLRAARKAKTTGERA